MKEYFFHMIFIFKSFIALISTNKNVWSQSEDVQLYIYFHDEGCLYYPKIPFLSVGNFWSYQKYLYVQYWPSFPFLSNPNLLFPLFYIFVLLTFFRFLGQSNFSFLKYEILRTFILWNTSFVIFLMIHLRSVSKK